MSKPTPVVFRPEFRPFVLRPTLWASAAALLMALGYFAVWEEAQLLLDQLVWPGLLAIFMVPGIVFAAHAIAYRKTNYALFSDRIVAHIGAVFGDRTVELQLINITQVEWKSPFFLKSFYGVGHITISEAGNAEQNARFICVKNPGDIYQLIAKNMRAQGFSMQRNARLAREKSGYLGAAVDMGVALIGVIWAVGALLESATPAYFLATSRIGRGMALALSKRADVVAESAQLANIQWILGLLGVVGIAVTIMGVVFFAVTKFIELTRRTATLYDDVVDYYAGFLSETRLFIPLENLTDTQLTRPLHKRVLGLSDLKISARGAGTDMQFLSMPNAEAFATALEKRLDAMEPVPLSPSEPKPFSAGARPPLPGSTGRQVTPENRPVEHHPPARPTRQIPEHTFQPVALRAALDPGGRVLYPLSLIIGVLGIPAAIGAALNPGVFTDMLDIIGPITVILIILALVAGVVVAGVRALIVANATEYSFDGRRARVTFDFMTRIETKFAVDKITMLTIHSNPIDRWLGTYSIHMRSVGSAEILAFNHIRADDARLGALLNALAISPEDSARAKAGEGYQSSQNGADNRPKVDSKSVLGANSNTVPGTPPNMVPGTINTPQNGAQRGYHGNIRPKYSFGSAISARLPEILIGVFVLALIFGALLYFEQSGTSLLGAPLLRSLAPGAVVLVGIFVPAAAIWQWMHTTRMHATHNTHALQFRGGILAHYHHFMAWRHIKTVETVCYPGTNKGMIVAISGGGGRIAIPFVPDIFMRHDQFDARVLQAVGADNSIGQLPEGQLFEGQSLGGISLVENSADSQRPGELQAAETFEFRPHLLLEIAQHISEMALTVVLIPFLPFSLPLIAWRARRTKYRLEKTRIQVDKPFFYHRRLSVLYAQIDHIESTRGLLNQLFGNRNIEVYTVGSATVDMVLHGVNAHERVTALIRARSAPAKE